MRTNIEIDDRLMARAMELTGLRTKRAVVDAALRQLVEWRNRQKLRESFGKFPWEGDLDQMRPTEADTGVIVVDSSVWVDRFQRSPLGSGRRAVPSARWATPRASSIPPWSTTWFNNPHETADAPFGYPTHT